MSGCSFNYSSMMNATRSIPELNQTINVGFDELGKVLEQIAIDYRKLNNTKSKTNIMNLAESFKYVFGFQYEDKKETKYGTIHLIASNMSEAQRMFDKLYCDTERCSPSSPKLHVINVAEINTLS